MHTAGAKAHVDFSAFAARLKSCPDTPFRFGRNFPQTVKSCPVTEPSRISRGMSFSSGAKAHIASRAFVRGLKPPPPSGAPPPFGAPALSGVPGLSGLSFPVAWRKLLARCRLLREESGSSLVEVALCVSLVGLPLFVGTVEMGSMMYGSIEVSNAAHAGAEYGMMSATFAADNAGVIRAAQGEATDFGANLTVTPTVYFACSQAVAGTQYTTQSAANAACTGTLNHSLEFIQVSTSTTVTPPIRCPGLASTYTLVGVSVMEIEE
jgi:Flp pilus assembly protein TadG